VEGAALFSVTKDGLQRPGMQWSLDLRLWRCSMDCKERQGYQVNYFSILALQLTGCQVLEKLVHLLFFVLLNRVLLCSLPILLLLPPECWDYRHVPQYLAFICAFIECRQLCMLGFLILK
jgi:hypothetical protein